MQQKKLLSINLGGQEKILELSFNDEQTIQRMGKDAKIAPITNNIVAITFFIPLQLPTIL